MFVLLLLQVLACRLVVDRAADVRVQDAGDQDVSPQDGPSKGRKGQCSAIGTLQHFMLYIYKLL